jgi:hypothetical protein
MLQSTAFWHSSKRIFCGQILYVVPAASVSACLPLVSFAHSNQLHLQEFQGLLSTCLFAPEQATHTLKKGQAAGFVNTGHHLPAATKWWTKLQHEGHTNAVSCRMLYQIVVVMWKQPTDFAMNVMPNFTLQRSLLFF